MKKVLSVMTMIALSATACGGDETNGGGTTTEGSTSTGSVAGGALSLDNCTTTISDDVPAFYRSYFKCSTISLSGEEVVIVTKGLPPHASNYYDTSSPNYAPFDTSRGAQYKANPNRLLEQNVTLRIPVNPKAINADISTTTVNHTVDGPTAGEFRMGAAGVALDSVVLYNPLAAPGDDIENEKYTFDDYNGHPDMSKTYHYHTSTKGPLEVLAKLKLVTTTTPEKAEIDLYGVMCDGTVVLGCKELDGSTPTSSALDAQNGHAHDIKDKDGSVLLAGRYHTHMCSTFPDATHKLTPEIQYYSTCSVTTK